jgi:hypothetical protein
MSDFWISSGHHLLDREQGGGLLVTDEFLKLYLARPEMIPPEEACAVERTLHAALLADPRMPVSASDIAAIADTDARENWQLLLEFRDYLLRHKTLEGAYVALIRNGVGKIPPLFVNQLVHVILRNALDGIEDARVLRAAEMFFRTQRVTLHDGSLIAADEETIGGINTSPVTPLVSMLGIPAEAEIDVINRDNADSYWQRSDQFDMALDLTAGRDGFDALAQAMQRWIAHVLGIEVTIEALTQLSEVDLAWYVGLDADATKLGDMLWHGEDIDETAMSRVVALFRLDFRDPAIMLDNVRGEPVYLILAMTADMTIRMKPQNLLTGLPVRHLEVVNNLQIETPLLWIVLRPVDGDPPYELAMVTADPAEGEGMTEAGANIVEAVAMPEPLREAIAAFVAEHHVEREFVKRKRDRADPEALARHGPAAREDRK